ncbi:hypothetical protein [Serratia sp. BIGb0163]|uniref:hypothetical protein n=1 Tax=Serratia sp. BIGb0163 TaxID=2940613 RepID=UPI00216A74F5|nr:hypothetical protein [Serratia sp. BIGb0163]MCS4267311.1 hypothetical protein [Serratia sp. BIGb0163]
MNNKLKLTLGTLPVLLSMVLTSAHAGSLGRSNSDTLDFTLTEPSKANVSVTPESGLLSGAALADNAKLATAVASLDAGGSASDLGVKWITTSEGGAIDPSNPGKYSLVSTSNKNQKLQVKLATKLDGTPAVAKASKTDTYVGTIASVEIADMTLYVLVDGPNQTPLPGTYSGVLQAAAFTN